MRTGYITHRPHHRAMAIVFTVVLAAAFFAFAPTAEACEPLGTLAITKVETGDTAPGGTYRFDISGPDHFVAEIDLTAGETWTTELPFGEYYIEERGAPVGHTIAPNPAVIDAEGATVTVTATNPYRDYHGKLAITKVVTGDTAPDRLFTFDVSGPGDLTFATEPIAAGETWTSDWLPLGDYTITERDAPDDATIVPNPVTLTDDEVTVGVTATNPYPNAHGSLAITKVETGDTAPSRTMHFPPDYEFEVTGPEGLVFPVTIAAGQTITIDPIPLGTYTITELGTHDATYSPGNVVVLDEHLQSVTVTATNHFRDFHGKLAITKVATGDTAPDADSTFDIIGPDDVTLTATVTPGTTWTSDWLALGTYTITERNAPDGHTITPNPVDLTEDGATVTVTATNTYRDFHGKLAITKVVTGTGTPSDTYRIDVTGPEVFTITLTAGQTWTSDWLPLGTYTITEPDGPAGHTIAPNPVELTEDGVTVTVTVTNPTFESNVAVVTLPATGQGSSGTVHLAVALLLVGAVAVASTHVVRRPQHE